MADETKLLECPFCSHPVISDTGKCPGCRHRLLPAYFDKVYCPSCGGHGYLEGGKCSFCAEKITVPEFEIGKYIEIPKRRRYKLITEREEALYQQMKKEHFEKFPIDKIDELKKNVLLGKKKYLGIFALIIINFIVFAILSMLGAVFKQEAASSATLSPKFFMSISMWFFLKAFFFVCILIFSIKKPIYSHLVGIIMLAVFFIFETVTLSEINIAYFISQILSFILLIYGAKLSILYEDYQIHYM